MIRNSDTTCIMKIYKDTSSLLRSDYLSSQALSTESAMNFLQLQRESIFAQLDLACSFACYRESYYETRSLVLEPLENVEENLS